MITVITVISITHYQVLLYLLQHTDQATATIISSYIARSQFEQFGVVHSDSTNKNTSAKGSKRNTSK